MSTPACEPLSVMVTPATPMSFRSRTGPLMVRSVDVTMVVVAVALLLAATGSYTVLPTVAVTEAVVAAACRSTSWRCTPCPTPAMNLEKVTAPAEAVPPSVADTKVAPAGIGTVSVIGPDPLAATVIV